MSDKRQVHDILSETGSTPDGRKQQRRPVAFIQHGNLEDGFQYEGVCPFCGTTTCFITDELVRNTIGGLYRLLLKEQKGHWTACTGQNAKEWAVEIATKPLNVEKPLVVE